jgi:large subunit ribosomal protein L23
MEQADQLNKYHFVVSAGANKVEIRQAVEAIFNVRVAKVNTINVKGKARQRSYRHRTGRTARVKKAIVTLVPGDRIDLLETT